MSNKLHTHKGFINQSFLLILLTLTAFLIGCGAADNTRYSADAGGKNPISQLAVDAHDDSDTVFPSSFKAQIVAADVTAEEEFFGVNAVVQGFGVKDFDVMCAAMGYLLIDLVIEEQVVATKALAVDETCRFGTATLRGEQPESHEFSLVVYSPNGLVFDDKIFSVGKQEPSENDKGSKTGVGGVLVNAL